MNFLSGIRTKPIRFLRKVVQQYYKIRLQRLSLWKEIERFKNSVNFDKEYKHYAKYFILYKTVRNMRPNFVLELGSGISSLIMGFALKENGRGTLISLEENASYGKEVMSTVGTFYPIEMRIEASIEGKYNNFTGHQYRNIPQKPYDLIFVDGPRTDKIDLDAFYVLERCPKAAVIIDNRKRTYTALRSKFPGNFNPVVNIGYINYDV